MDERHINRVLDRRDKARRQRQRKQATGPSGLKPEEPAPPTGLDPRRPPWVPAGVDLGFVPAEVVQSIDQIIVPIYEQLVVDAPDPLERSLGVTLVHLLWLETLQQFDMKREYTQICAVLDLPIDTGSTLAGHLRLIDSKLRAGSSLLRLRRLRLRQQREQDAGLARLPQPPPGTDDSQPTHDGHLPGDSDEK